MLRGFGWLSVLTAIVKEVVKPTLPPMPYCPICGARSVWLVKGVVWGCNGPTPHSFDVDYKGPFVVDPLLKKPARDYEGEI